jgi:hypothetical protein
LIARHVGALHQAFLVDVRVEELVAVALEQLHRLHGRERQHGLPSVNADATRRESTAAITRCMPTVCDQRPREVVIDHLGQIAVGRSRKRPDPAITACAPALISSSARRTLRTPPPTRQGSLAAICLTSSSLLPRDIAASRSISWTFGISQNFAIQPSRIVGRDGELVTLHELDDTAALEINRRNQHKSFTVTGKHERH